ncbi:MAG: NAD(P)/FAD-dependent oxidoreductase [Thaumarchaeota archaeon]|nr:NAD(P)/FAD-dependent oxidoreductase [Candidatus Calditenuaceae archaeon]MDW8042209.1 NAD(P)/FAD-dependent oxidoreductase [Nitrososphaerota archaeon]
MGSVAVVGAGPAGLTVARELSRMGHDVTVFEEDEVIGRPEHCAGLYSLAGLRKIGAWSTSYVVNAVRGAVFTSSRGKELLVERPAPIAVVARREELDRYLAELAVSKGADIEIGRRVESVRAQGNLSLLLNGEWRRFDAAVIAEGMRRTLTRSIYGPLRASTPIPIAQSLIRGHGLDPDRVYVWFEPYLEDYFAYAVPLNEELARIGLASRSDTLGLLKKFTDTRFAGAKTLGYQIHTLWLDGPLDIGLDGRVVLVGDCAGQTKPLTGGGVVVGGLCALSAARHVHALLEEGKDGTYRKLVRWIYADLRATKFLRDELNRRVGVDALIELASDSGIGKELSVLGDMDFHALSLLRSLPSLSGLRFIVGLLAALF